MLKRIQVTEVSESKVLVKGNLIQVPIGSRAIGSHPAFWTTPNMTRERPVTGIERTFPADEIIVSKTDLKGRLTYANKVFLDIAGYTEQECLGQPHSMIRHPDMPRCIFKLLWDTIQNGREIFAYVVNRCKNGDHYWVYAHVTPSFDGTGNIIGYHSNRRVPNRALVDGTIIPLYTALREEERRHANAKQGLEASFAMVEAMLEEKGMAYDEFVMTLDQPTPSGASAASEAGAGPIQPAA